MNSIIEKIYVDGEYYDYEMCENHYCKIVIKFIDDVGKESNLTSI